MIRLVVVSDIHYAGPAERERGEYRSRPIRNPLLRLFTQRYHHHVWLRDPFAHNYLLDAFLQSTGTLDLDLAVANGDFSCDSGAVGVSDSAALQSATECLTRLRRSFAGKFHAILGDHELGKMTLFGGAGGMRLRSWHLAVGDLQLQPFWRIDHGRYVLLGVTSSLIALPIFDPEILAEEKREWEALREIHLAAIDRAFASLPDGCRVILFCHDPSALPFLAQIPSVRSKLAQIEHTVIGHLHSPLIFWKGRLLAGMPRISFLGNTIRRYSTALSKARCWADFGVVLCPALTGIELLKDGGYLRLEFDPKGERTVHLERIRLPWV